MSNITPTQLHFDPSAGFTIRADFEGGGLSSGLVPLLLRCVDKQIGLTQRLAVAIDDCRHPSYIQLSRVNYFVRYVLPQLETILLCSYIPHYTSVPLTYS